MISSLKSKTLALANGNDESGIRRLMNRLVSLKQQEPSAFDNLEAWWPEDSLCIKFYREPGKSKAEILSQGASAGQKAATILAFLLNVGTEPLIIDQPEDDLDNSLITALIVNGIYLNKGKRQIILATHNPNIVVNGDAEQVLVMNFINGQIIAEKSGSLEEIDIRESICSIMEGGKEAFDKRYTRIMHK